MDFFFSTSCLPRNYGFSRILNIYSQMDIKNVELGVCLELDVNHQKLIKDYDFNYIVHQLFPPPSELFIVNLASTNNTILTKSINQIFKSIDFCVRNNIHFFSFHAGFRIDPDINFKFNLSQKSDYEKPYNIFKNSIIKIIDYAESRHVKIGIENNVLAKHNLVNGENTILLMCELWEFERLLKEINSDLVNILLDLGHLKVTSNTLNFDKNEFILNLKEWVVGIHIHENDGLVDEHKIIKKGDWSVNAIEYFFHNKDIPIIMESKFRNEDELRDYIDFF